MALAKQQSLFGDPQPDLFPAAPLRYQPETRHVRNRLDRLLVEARAAEALPWGEAVVGLYRGVFAQLKDYLPAVEGERYQREFEAELSRLGA